jgi:hypothetical protein
VIEHYEARAAEHAARRAAQAAVSVRISRARLATFIPGAAAVIWALADAGRPIALAGGALLLVVFACLVFVHARVEERVAWHDALHEVNLHAVARIARAWDRLPPAEPPSASVWAPEHAARVPAARGVTGSGEDDEAHLETHPYATDLDLFGRASLMQWLGPAATAAGTNTLHRWLLGPAPPDVVRKRQEAVVELTPASEWREALAAHGRLAADVRQRELETFLRWAESSGPMSARAVPRLRLAVAALTAAIWILMGLHAAGATGAALWLVPLVLGMVLSFAASAQIHGEFDRAGAGLHALARYEHLFAHAVAAPDSAPALRDIQARLTVEGSRAPDSMRSLFRVLGFAQLRSGAAILHFPIQAVTLWDFHVFFALDRWRRHAGPNVRGWMQAIGELDALSVFSQVKADNPSWSLPAIQQPAASEEKVFAARNLGHPLIPADRRVGNDVEVGPPGTVLLITGSNMSGKSTLLRAIGLNAVLAQAGAPVCATSLRMPLLDLETSIRVQDSLEHGLSYFMAALARLKGVVDRTQQARRGHTVMYLLDEILQGTNTAERALAVRGVARHLLAAGAIGVMTTHDLSLAEQEPLDSAARLAHFSDTVDDHGGMSFDYRLRPGLATSRNALRLMHLLGIDV